MKKQNIEQFEEELKKKGLCKEDIHEVVNVIFYKEELKKERDSLKLIIENRQKEVE